MLGNQIQKLRREKNLTLSQLAVKTEISKSYLSHIERNIQRNPSIEILTKLASALEVNIQTLITPDPPEPILETSSEQKEKDWNQLINNALASGTISEKVLQEIIKAIQNSKQNS